MNSSVTITIKDIYGTENPNIPEDYEAVEFRVVKPNEQYLPSQVATEVWIYTSNSSVGRAGPRIILQKKKKYQFVFREYGEIKPGEWGLNISGIVLSGQSTFPEIREAGNCWPGQTMIFDRVEVKE